MSAKLEEYQINYDNIQKDLVRNEVLCKKIESKIKELGSSDGIFSELLVYRANVRITELKSRIRSSKAYIDTVKKRHEEFEPYKHYKADLKKNIETLEARKEEYKALFESLPLRAEDDKGELLRPKLWYLDEKKAQWPPAFKPIATQSAVSHSSSATLNTIVRYPKKRDYSFTTFCYADDGTVLDHRFFMYWGMDEVSNQNKNTASYMPDQLYAAYSVGGLASQLTVYKRNLEILNKYVENECVNPNSDEVNGKRYELKIPLKSQHIGEVGDYNASYRLSDTRIKLDDATAFFLYPLDQAPFVTEKLTDIVQLDAPKYPSYLTSQKVVFTGGEEEAPDKIYLHCTLPEWNYRLRKAVSELQLQINEYNLLLSPHYAKLGEVAQMREIVELHTRHSIASADKASLAEFAISPIFAAFKNLSADASTPEQQLKSRKRLAAALDQLHEGIETIIDNPSSSDVATFYLHMQKKHIDECAKTVWELLQSEAFLAELTAYLEHIKGKDAQEGQLPSGPYMAEEDWGAIFVTIAECYAALSASEHYAKLAWENDIIHGLDKLADIGNDSKAAKMIKDSWLTVNKSEIEADYIDDQDTNLAETPKSKPQTSVFSALLENYASLLKPYLTHVVPGPGADCTLQVILNCYQPQITQHILKTVSKDITYHIRLFRGTALLFGIINERDTRVPGLLGRDVRDIFSAFIVTKDIRRSRERAKKTSAAFTSYFDSIPEGKKEKSFYEGRILGSKSKSVSHGATYGKSIYTLFNLTLSIQMLQALDEVAKDNNWGQDRIILEYTNALTQVAMGAGTSTMAMLNIARRINYLGLSQSAVKGATGYVHTNLDKLLGYSTVPLTILTTVLSAYQAAEHIREQRYREAVYTGISATAGVMLTAGFILQTAGKRFAVQMVFGISTGPLAGVFLIVGTAVNIALLAYDAAKMIKSTSASSSQKFLVNQWQHFKQPPQPLDRHILKEFGLERTKGSEWSTNIWSLEHNALLDNSDTIIKLYEIAPYDIYVGNEGGWATLQLTVEPIETIEDLHDQELFDSEGVRLGELNWRAVVPLHNIGIPAEQIEEMVNLGIGNFDKLTGGGIESVADIIAYYEEVKAHYDQTLIPARLADLYNIETPLKTIEHIAVLLEQGRFTPPKEAPFHRASDWQHPALQIHDSRN